MLAAYIADRMTDTQGSEFTLQTWGVIALGLVLTTTVTTLPQAFLTRPVIAEAEGRRVTMGESLRLGAALALPILLLGFIYAIAVITGLALLIIPGVILMLIWPVSAPALVEERGSIVNAFRRSRYLTRGARWKIVALLLIFYAVLIVMQAGTEAISGEWDRALLATAYSHPFYLALTAISETLFIAFWCSAFAALYLELRNWKEGPGAEKLERIFA